MPNNKTQTVESSLVGSALSQLLRRQQPRILDRCHLKFQWTLKKSPAIDYWSKKQPIPTQSPRNPSKFTKHGPMKSFASLFSGTWNGDHTLSSKGETLVVFILKNEYIDCTYHGEISLTPTVTKVLAIIMLHRLKFSRESNVRKQQTAFDRSLNWIEQIFPLHQLS